MVHSSLRVAARGVFGPSRVAFSLHFISSSSRLLSVHKVWGQGPPPLSCLPRGPAHTSFGGLLCLRHLVSPSSGPSAEPREAATGGGGPPEGGPSGAEGEGLASADSQYQAAATCLLEGLAEQIQEVQETSRLEDVDYGASPGLLLLLLLLLLQDGVLKIVCEGGVTLVLNKHYVTKQIWFASPLSGAMYFDYALGWVCGRTGATLLEALSRDVERATGQRPPALSWPQRSSLLLKAAAAAFRADTQASQLAAAAPGPLRRSVCQSCVALLKP
ncbi:hypothetical protein Esti_003204 [Eimeria stiedai]